MNWGWAIVTEWIVLGVAFDVMISAAFRVARKRERARHQKSADWPPWWVHLLNIVLWPVPAWALARMLFGGKRA